MKRASDRPPLPVLTARRLHGQELKDALERLSSRPALEDYEDLEEVVTMDEGLNWADRICRCHGCGKVARCTIWEDFYTLAFRPTDKHLYCEGCMFAEARKDGTL